MNTSTNQESEKNSKSQSKNNIIRTNLLIITYNETKDYLNNCTIRINDVLPIENANKLNYYITEKNEFFGCNQNIVIRKQSSDSNSSNNSSNDINYCLKSKITLKSKKTSNFNYEEIGEVREIDDNSRKIPIKDKIEKKLLLLNNNSKTRKIKEDINLKTNLEKLKNIVSRLKIMSPQNLSSTIKFDMFQDDNSSQVSPLKFQSDKKLSLLESSTLEEESTRINFDKSLLDAENDNFMESENITIYKPKPKSFRPNSSSSCSLSVKSVSDKINDDSYMI